MKVNAAAFKSIYPGICLDLMIENSVDYGFIKIDLVKPFESVKPCPSFFTCKPSILLLYVKLGRGLRLQTLLDNFVDVLRFILKKKLRL